MAIKVSVIIPTYKDWDRLSKCLLALENQTFNSNEFEIIVVDNDPKSQKIKRYSNKNLKIISEYKVGSYAARNRGIKIAKGELLAFTDSDCIPCPEWISTGYRDFIQGKERIGGEINLFSEIKDSLSIYSLYENLFSFNQIGQVNKGRAMTANLFVKKDIFCDVGLFNESHISGGDIEWGSRAHSAGYKIYYSEKAFVMHPTRDNLQELLSKKKRVAIGNIGHDKVEISKLILNILIPPFNRIKNIIFLSRYSLITRLKLILLVYSFKIYSISIKLLVMSKVFIKM